MDEQSLSWLKANLELLDRTPTECDGLTRLIATRLIEWKVPHTIYCGTLAWRERQAAPIHFWLELENNWLIDYRVRMWCQLIEQSDRLVEEVPHGIFQPNSYPNVYYQGFSLMPEELGVPLSKAMFELLTLDFPNQV